MLAMFSILGLFIVFINAKLNTGENDFVYIEDISERNFTVGWRSESFVNAHNYTVNLNEIKGCPSTEYNITCTQVTCKFSIPEDCNLVSPCTDVALNVTGNNITADELQFNTAPHVLELQKMTLEVNGTIITISWNSENPDTEGSQCATRADAQINVYGEAVKEDIVDTTLGQTNAFSVDLAQVDPCKSGGIDAKVTYVTLLSEYKTSATHRETADNDYLGVGIDEPPKLVPGEASCSIKASWHSACDVVDYYHLTCGDDKIYDISDTSYIIPDLRAEHNTVCVSAYVDDILLGGEPYCNSLLVEQELPGTTVIKKLGSESDSKEELTVFWTEPPMSTCTVIAGFHITWKEEGEDLINGSTDTSMEATSYTITGLRQCVLYEVTVDAFSDVGNGPAGSMTSSLDDYCSKKQHRDERILVIAVIAFAGLMIIALICTLVYVNIKKNWESKNLPDTDLSDLQLPKIIPRETINRNSPLEDPYTESQYLSEKDLSDLQPSKIILRSTLNRNSSRQNAYTEYY